MKKRCLLLLLLFSTSIGLHAQSNATLDVSTLTSSNFSKKEGQVPLTNFSDSVYSVMVPPEVLWKFKCEEIEPFMKEAFNVSLQSEIKFEDKITQARKVVRDPNGCSEGLIWVDDETALADQYFTKFDYFGKWDTQNVDPYGYKIKNFKDTVLLELFNREKGSAWSEPLARQTKVNSKYGPRWYRWHHGVDLKIDLGDPVQATFDGVVRIAKYNRGGYGYYVMLRHANGLETLYGHLAKYNVKPGDVVKAGDVIGYGGNTGRSTGPHLHFEVRYQGHAIDPRHMFDFDDNGGRLYFREFVLTPYHYKGLINQSKGQYHRVRNGESLWVISRRYRTPIRRICRLNGISKNSVLRVGKVLRVR